MQPVLPLAASRTPGLRRGPAPLVLQTALSAFCVEYQLTAWRARREERNQLLSALYANIPDPGRRPGTRCPRRRGRRREAGRLTR